MSPTVREIAILCDLIRKGGKAIYDQGHDTGDVRIDRQLAIRLLEAYRDLDEIHRIADRNVGAEYRETKR